jgi:hypothetical protein
LQTSTISENKCGDKTFHREYGKRAARGRMYTNAFYTDNLPIYSTYFTAFPFGFLNLELEEEYIPGFFYNAFK